MPLSSNAPFSEFGQSMILRDIEQIYLALNGAGVGSAGDGQTQDQAVEQTQETGDSGGITDLSGLATVDYVDQVANQLLDSIPTVTYPIGIANGGTGQTTQQLALDALAGGVTANRVLRADGSHVALGQVARADMVNSVAVSVIGRSAGTTGAPADIAAGADNQVLGRRSGALTWATIGTSEITASAVTKAKLEDSAACSVIGRAANSTGVTADISASADAQILTRASSALSWLTAPTADGQVLTRTGSGVIAWSSPSTSGTLQQTITSNVSITIPAGTRRVVFVIIGGGGGGAGSNSSTSGVAITNAWAASVSGGATTNQLAAYYLGSSGASGSVLILDMDATNLNTVSSTIGAAGAAGTDTAGLGTAGGDGGNTTLSFKVGSTSYSGVAAGGGGGQYWSGGSSCSPANIGVPTLSTATNLLMQIPLASGPGSPGAFTMIASAATQVLQTPIGGVCPWYKDSTNKYGFGGRASVPAAAAGPVAGKQGAIYVFY